MSFPPAEIGEIQEGVSIEWKIRNFSELSKEVDDCYYSPVFSFSDSLWCLRLCPNGKTRTASSGSTSLHLVRKDSGPPKTVSYNFGIKDADGIAMAKQLEWNFKEKDEIYGWIKFCHGHDWKEQRIKLLQNMEMTIICDLKNYAHGDAKASLDNRRGNLVHDLKSILTEGKRSDFTLKLGSREWPVHKVILESRSEYFANMFRHEWVENTVGEVRFNDIGEDALRNILHFIYTSEVHCMSRENVCEIYFAAHKFLLEDLKAMCIEYMKKSLCEETISRVLTISKTYGENELHELALEYFFQKSRQNYWLRRMEAV